MQRAIYLISGIPGAGKTTVSRLLASRFERGVHLESDLLQEIIVTGGLWPDAQPHDEAMRQLRLRGRNVCLLADSFFDAGFTPVVDDVIVGTRLQECLEDLSNRPVIFVLLVPHIDVVSHRDATRDEKHVFDKWGYLDETMRSETDPIGLWLDTSHMTADETVDAILRDGWERGRIE